MPLLKVQEAKTNEKIELFKCKYCDISLCKKEDLKIHITKVHEKLKPSSTLIDSKHRELPVLKVQEAKINEILEPEKRKLKEPLIHEKKVHEIQSPSKKPLKRSHCDTLG